MVTIRQDAFVRTTNQRSNDGTGLDDWALRRQQLQRYDHNVDAETRKKTIFRLTPTTIQHNVDAGMRDSRLTPTTATTTHGEIGAGGP
jgi:hypothetical protein